MDDFSVFIKGDYSVRTPANTIEACQKGVGYVAGTVTKMTSHKYVETKYVQTHSLDSMHRRGAEPAIAVSIQSLRKALGSSVAFQGLDL